VLFQILSALLTLSYKEISLVSGTRISHFIPERSKSSAILFTISLLNSHSNNLVPSGHLGEHLPGVSNPCPLSKITVMSLLIVLDTGVLYFLNNPNIY
jgi:hypothetical protein